MVRNIFRAHIARQLIIFLFFAAGVESAARAEYLLVRDRFLQEAQPRLPGVTLYDLKDGIILQTDETNRLRAWGALTIDNFYIEGIGSHSFANGPFKAGTPSGIILGHWKIDGIRVRVSDEEIGFIEFYDLSLEGDWNKDPAGGFYYDQPVTIPEAQLAKLKKGHKPRLKTQIINPGYLTLTSLPLEQIRTFAGQKLAALQQQKQAEEQARQRAEAEQRAAEQRAAEEHARQTATNNPSGGYSDDYGNSGESRADRERREREEREARERRILQRQADQSWDTYQNVLKGIDDAFKVDPEVQRQRELEAEQDELEYERRRQAEDERYWAEQDRLERERAEKERQEAEKRRQKSIADAKYRAQRDRDYQTWSKDGSASKFFTAKFKWMDEIADSLVLFDKQFGFEGQDRNHYKSEYASPAGQVKLAKKILTDKSLPLDARSYIGTKGYVFFDKWVKFHQAYNFYPYTPSCPTCRTGEVPDKELDVYRELRGYWHAASGADVSAPGWGNGTPEKTLSAPVTLDKHYEAGSEMNALYLGFSNSFMSSTAKAYKPKFGMTLKPEHIRAAEEYLAGDYVKMTPGFETYRKLSILNLLMAHHLNVGEPEWAYFRMQQAFVQLGVEKASDLFTRPVIGRSFSHDNFMKSDHTERLIYNAAYIYKANGHFAECEYIINKVLAAQWPELSQKVKPNTFDMAVALMDMYAQEGRWKDLLALTDRFSAAYPVAARTFYGFSSASTVQDHESGLYAERPRMQALDDENTVYRALAQTRLGNTKGAKKTLKATLKSLKNYQTFIRNAPTMMRVLDPLLQELLPKDHKKYIAGKAFEVAPAFGTTLPAITLAEMQADPDIWYNRHKADIEAYDARLMKWDYDGARAIAIKLMPTLAAGADLTDNPDKSLGRLMRSEAWHDHTSGDYLGGMAFADVYRRLNKRFAREGEAFLALNALFGNYNWVRLHELGSWIDQGAADGKAPAPRTYEDYKQKPISYLVDALAEYSRDDKKFLVEAMMKQHVAAGNTDPHVMYLSSARFWSAFPVAK